MIVHQTALDPFRAGRIILQNCLILLICSSILAPPIPSIGGLPFLKAEQVLVPVLFILYCWLLMAGFVPVFRVNGMFFIGVFYTFSILVSMWYGAVVLGQTVVPRDLFDVIKLWFPIVFFTMAYETKLSERGLLRLLYAYGFSTLLICFYAWGQWRGVGLTIALNSYYSGGVHDQALYLTKRVYSTMGNPNVLGQLLSWAVVCFLLALLAKVGNRLWSGLLILSCIVTIGMTASRYALLTTIAGIALVLMPPFSASSSSKKERNVRIALMLLLLTFVGLIAFVVIQSNQYAVARYQELKNPGQVNSLRERLDNLWWDALADFGHSPIVGIGTAKAKFGELLDSEYILVLQHTGLVGFAVYISFFLYPFYFLWKGMRMASQFTPLWEAQMRANVLTVRFSSIMVILALLMNFGETTFANAFLQGFLWLWLGVGTRSARTICEAVEFVPVRGNSHMLSPSLLEGPARDA